MWNQSYKKPYEYNYIVTFLTEHLNSQNLVYSREDLNMHCKTSMLPNQSIVLSPPPHLDLLALPCTSWAIPCSSLLFCIHSHFFSCQINPKVTAIQAN